MTRHSKMRGSYVRFLLVMAFSSIHDFDMGDFSRILASHRSLSMRSRARRGPIRPIGNCEAVPNIIASAAARGSKQHLERGRPAARKADELAPPHGAFPSGQTPGGRGQEIALRHGTFRPPRAHSPADKTFRDHPYQ